MWEDFNGSFNLGSLTLRSEVRFLCCQPPSNAFGCIYFDYHWDEIPSSEYAMLRKPTIPEEHRERFSDSINRKTAAHDGITDVGFAALVCNAAAVRWLASEGLSANHWPASVGTIGHLCLIWHLPRHGGWSHSAHEMLEILVGAGLDLGAKDKFGLTCFAFTMQSMSLDQALLQVFLNSSYDIFETMPARPRRGLVYDYLLDNSFWKESERSDYDKREHVTNQERSGVSGDQGSCVRRDEEHEVIEGADDGVSEELGQEAQPARQLNALEFAITGGHDDRVLGVERLLSWPLSPIPYDDERAALALIPPFFERYGDSALRATWLGLAAQHSRISVIECLLEHGARPTDRDQEGCLPLERAVQYGKAYDYRRGKNIDLLAPLTLGQGVQYRRTEGRWPIEAVVGICSLHTVKLFTEHVTDGPDMSSLWGLNLISKTLRENCVHGIAISPYLYNLGVRDREPEEGYDRFLAAFGIGENCARPATGSNPMDPLPTDSNLTDSCSSSVDWEDVDEGGPRRGTGRQHRW